MSLADSDIDPYDGSPPRRLVSALGDFGSAPPSSTGVMAGMAVATRRAAGAVNLSGKSLFDRLAAAMLLLASLPIIAVFAALIWCIDRHFPFYAQPRVGQYGLVFRVWKLRSMFIDADVRLAEHLATDLSAAAEWQRCFKLSNDPRLLPLIGDFIRRSSLDELPQLWNVLLGEMSLVGPRPFPSYHLDRFSQEFRELRCSVSPGLTGLWQIRSRSNGDLSDQEHWDVEYIRNRSFSLDLRILILTLPAVLSARGAR